LGHAPPGDIVKLEFRNVIHDARGGQKFEPRAADRISSALAGRCAPKPACREPGRGDSLLPVVLRLLHHAGSTHAERLGEISHDPRDPARTGYAGARVLRIPPGDLCRSRFASNSNKFRSSSFFFGGALWAGLIELGRGTPPERCRHAHNCRSLLRQRRWFFPRRPRICRSQAPASMSSQHVISSATYASGLGYLSGVCTGPATTSIRRDED
jgi:hypothetical protein